jgi:hypothetical protein
MIFLNFNCFSFATRLGFGNLAIYFASQSVIILKRFRWSLGCLLQLYELAGYFWGAVNACKIFDFTINPFWLFIN